MFSPVYAPLLCLLSLVLPVAGITQYSGNLSFEYYSVNDGLSDRMVTDMVQSPNGLMWAGNAQWPQPI